MKDLPNWVIPAALIAVGFIAYRKLSNVGRQAIQAAQGTAIATGEKISSSVFDFLHPSLRPENYNKPTVVNAQVVAGNYVCPKGYRYKLTLRGEHLCFRED